MQAVITDMMHELSEEAAFDYAKRALPLMARHGVKPTPNNYAVWYVYVADGNEELVHEIDTILKEKIAFTEDICEYLYTKYIAEIDSRIVHQTTVNMRELMADVLSNITQFTGEASDYRQELNQQIQTIPGLDDSGVERLVEALSSRMGSMLESSGALSERLEASRREIEDLKQNLAQIKTESERDFLTGVYNRKALDQLLEDGIAEAAAADAPLCLLMVDVDHFKAFNDRHGHLIGDEVLKIVARVLTDSVKGKDRVARFGGEEFSVLLPHTPVGGAMTVAEHIRKAIANKELKRRDTGETYGQLTVSIGVAMYRPGEDTIPTFIKRADEALYRAKKSGRNRVVQEAIKHE